MPVTGFERSIESTPPVPERNVSRGTVTKRRAKSRNARAARRHNRKG